MIFECLALWSKGGKTYAKLYNEVGEIAQLFLYIIIIIVPQKPDVSYLHFNIIFL